MMKATFAAGCFWGVESEFRKVDGVIDTKVGYTGGHVESPTYEMVCGHGTGHAEAVQVEFDESVVSYEQLLELFWQIHNPTTLNRQGWDIGDQYRSAIFFHDADQEIAAHKSMAEAQGHQRKRIVTQIVPAERFWLAEEYHQRYNEKRGVITCNTVLKAKAEAEAAL